MDESHFLEEIRNWAHPPWYGITQFEEKIQEIFKENQKGLHHHYLKTHLHMPVKQELIFSPFQETSFSAPRWTQSETLLAEGRIIPCSTEIHWRLQNYTKEFGCYARKPHLIGKSMDL